MPLENSFSSSPYFDDYEQQKNFYKILFKPSVAVQARELNQLQTILQNQIERFGDHVFKSGTVISGVNFTYLPLYNYVKILDTQVDGITSLPSSYVNFFIKSGLNLTGRIINYEDGLESRSPNLKTLYVQYINSSDVDSSNGNAIYTSFAPGEQLTIFSKDNQLFKYIVAGGGSGFSNSDNLVVLSAIKLTGNSYGFQAGERITQSTTGAKAVIKTVNTTAFSNTTVLTIKPLNSDLIGSNSAAWAFEAGYNIVGNISLSTAAVANIVGSGAQGIVRTDSLGIVTSVSLTEGGTGYEILPHVTINTSNTTADISTLDITPQNYKAIVTVGNNSINSVGSGYAFGVTEGIIYQKGHFLRVSPQVIIVDKYSTVPDEVAVGFTTVETTVDSNADSSLFDNAANTTNFAAPGADRLKLTPVLTKLTTSQAAANVDFFALAEWKEGKPYKENRVSVYNQLGDQMARRTYEAQGDFVIDPFNVTTKDKNTSNTTTIRALIDPGTAYVSGYRVQTRYNNYLDVARSTTTTTLSNQRISVNYGNYIKVKQLTGLFNFKAGDTISLRDAAKSYISGLTISASSITPSGSEIGTARIRSLVVDNGDPGTPDCVYRIYLFDITMNAGKSFRQVRALWYNGPVQDGIADAVLEVDTTTGSSIAVLKDTQFDRMIFGLRQRGVKTIDNIQYTYRTVSDTTLQIGATGELDIGPLGSGLQFPYDGELSSTEKKDFLVFPIANAQASSNIGGNVSTTSSCTVVTGVGTSFLTTIQPGDFLKIANSSASIIGQVKSIANNTQLTLYANATSSITGEPNNAVQFFPSLYPIPLENRDDRSINVDASQTTATIDIGTNLSGTVNVFAVYNITRTSAAPVPKSINRNLYVKIHTSNNENSNTGPWALGVPGVARLKNVYLGNSSVVDTTSTDVTKYFYVDTGDDENAYRSAKLVLNKNAGLAISKDQFLLVKFDAFTISGVEGFFTVDSYEIDDTLSLANSISTINTLEIPETTTTKGQYFDLRDSFDFRPVGANTAALSTTVGSATINPSSTFSLSGDDQLFPAPDAIVTFDIQYYNSRQDRVILPRNGLFEVKQGTPLLTQPKPPTITDGSLTLATLFVPPYPSLPAILNANTLEFVSKKTGDAKGQINRRVATFTVSSKNVGGAVVQQPRRYSMSDIAKLDRRISQVEYSVSLSLIENAIKDLVIPSSITPTTERFKNGFFVDPFIDNTKANLTSKEYSASIDQFSSLLRPPTRQINFESQFDRNDPDTLAAITNDNTLMLPYINEVIIDQTIKSSVVGSDGIKIKFIGEGTVEPASFSVSLRAEVVITNIYVPDPPPPANIPGYSPNYIINDGGDVGLSNDNNDFGFDASMAGSHASAEDPSGYGGSGFDSNNGMTGFGDAVGAADAAAAAAGGDGVSGDASGDGTGGE
jgi:hypothetical protein